MALADTLLEQANGARTQPNHAVSQYGSEQLLGSAELMIRELFELIERGQVNLSDLTAEAREKLEAMGAASEQWIDFDAPVTYIPPEPVPTHELDDAITSDMFEP